MRLIKGFLAGLVLAGIPAMMPAAAFAHGGGGHGFRRGGGGHAFVGGGGHGFGNSHAFGGFTGRGFSPGFSGTRGFLLVDFLVAEITAALVTVVSVTIVSFFNSLPGLFIGIPTILTITPIWITDRITTINMGTIQPRLCNRNPSDPPSTIARCRQHQHRQLPARGFKGQYCVRQ